MSEINTTPFVDVMLVLLVIFIITAPLVGQGLSLSLPKADAPRVAAQDTLIRLEINEKGEIFLQDEAIALADLESALMKQAQEDAERTVQIRAEGALPYARVVELMALARTAGLTNLTLMTDPLPAQRPAAPPAR